MNRSTLLLLALSKLLVLFANSQCGGELSLLASCISTNAGSCISSCGSAIFSLDTLLNDCNSTTDLCQMQQCCPPCINETIAYADCLLPLDCVSSCEAPTTRIPSIPISAPIAPSPIGPPVASPALYQGTCQSDYSIFSDCLLQNFVSCGSACDGVGPTADIFSNDDLFSGCSGIATSCDAINCCPPCVDAGKSLVACEAALVDCPYNCSDVPPVAPSPVIPTPTQPIGACTEKEIIADLCLKSSLLQCAACTNLDDGGNMNDDGIPGGCINLDTFCRSLSCCPQCETSFKDLVGCYSDMEGCGRTCDDVAPSSSTVVPSATSIAPVVLMPLVTMTPSVPPPIIASDPTSVNAPVELPGGPSSQSNVSPVSFPLEAVLTSQPTSSPAPWRSTAVPTSQPKSNAAPLPSNASHLESMYNSVLLATASAIVTAMLL